MFMVVLPKVGWMLWGLNPALMWNKASIRYWMALTPVSGTDPWAVTPAEWIFTQSRPFSAETTAEPVGSAMMEASKALMSWSLTKARAPQPSTSSPQVAKKTTSPLRGFPLWAWSFRAAAKASRPAFMSPVPRPYMVPSTICAPKGSYFQLARSPTGTTSRWPLRRMAFFSPVPLRVAIKFLRFSPISWKESSRLGQSPRYWASRSAQGASSPGGAMLGIWISCCKRRTNWSRS